MINFNTILGSSGYSKYSDRFSITKIDASVDFLRPASQFGTYISGLIICFWFLIAAHQLFIDFNKAYDSVRREVLLYNILI
jgi:hypothetical protein